ncbi:hypothetical protein [Kitasatospora sp. HPMI-4]
MSLPSSDRASDEVDADLLQLLPDPEEPGLATWWGDDEYDYEPRR